MQKVHWMMALTLVAGLALMVVDVETAICDPIDELQEAVAELIDVEPAALVTCNTISFVQGCYRFQLLYENSTAERVNEFGWAKYPHCLVPYESGPVEVEARSSAKAVQPAPDVSRPRLCGCGGFHELFDGLSEPGDMLVRSIWTRWLPALNSPALRSHCGGYYTSLARFNWDERRHLQVFCIVDPDSPDARPTSWILCWFDKCNAPFEPVYYDSMIIRVDYLPAVECPQVEEY